MSFRQRQLRFAFAADYFMPAAAACYYSPMFSFSPQRSFQRLQLSFRLSAFFITLSPDSRQPDAYDSQRRRRAGCAMRRDAGPPDVVYALRRD